MVEEGHKMDVGRSVGHLSLQYISHLDNVAIVHSLHLCTKHNL